MYYTKSNHLKFIQLRWYDNNKKKKVKFYFF